MRDSTHDDGFQDRIGRILNEHKRQELEDKYGLHFSSPRSNPDLPPEVEAQWLGYVDEFERQFEQAERVALRQFIGSPAIRPLADIPPAEVGAELNRLLDILAEHGIFVDFLYDVDPTEAYRFITEELLEEAIDGVRIPGLQFHFIYEEFHPNDVEDAKQWAQEFISSFLEDDREGLMLTVGDRELLDPHGAPITPARIGQLMKEFHAKHVAISNVVVKPLRCEVEGDNASVELAVSWEGKADKPEDEITTAGRATIRLRRSPYGGWDVTQAGMPGLG